MALLSPTVSDREVRIQRRGSGYSSPKMSRARVSALMMRLSFTNNTYYRQRELVNVAGVCIRNVVSQGRLAF